MAVLRNHQSLHRGHIREVNPAHAGAFEQLVPAAGARQRLFLVDAQFRRGWWTYKHDLPAARAKLRDRDPRPLDRSEDRWRRDWRRRPYPGGTLMRAHARIV